MESKSEEDYLIGFVFFVPWSLWCCVFMFGDKILIVRVSESRILDM